MPKRSYEEKMDNYMRKMEKLSEKYHRKRRRREDDEPNVNQEGETALWGLSEPLLDHEKTVPLPDHEVMVPLPAPDETLFEVVGDNSVPTQQNDPPPPPPVALQELTQVSEDSGLSLDPEILSALGEATDHGPKWGLDIHNNLTQLWEPLLKKGMAKETKDKIIKQYLIPSNCMLLQAPKLNIEISAAILEMVRLRDKKVETTQQQLGTGITAISRAMTSLITSDNKIEAIKTLSDGCRILCDLHFSETQARIKMITPGLAKPFLNVIQDSERDETLFGATLSDKIKASKTIEKQGLQIKKTVQNVRPNQVTQNTLPARQQFQGNWTGPPRYPMNRGGRGGQKRYPLSSRRQLPATASATAAQPRANQSRSRAPTRP